MGHWIDAVDRSSDRRDLAAEELKCRQAEVLHIHAGGKPA